MLNENIKSISYIERNSDGVPTIIDGTIKEGCLFENTLMKGWGTIVIDNEFINDIIKIVNENELSPNLIELLTNINNKINNYFYSTGENNKLREETYANSYVMDENFQIIGTKLSSLKGKNVAVCSEKSIAAYIALKNLYDKNKISRKPSMILSTLSIENTSSEPHAFILIDKDDDKYPTKHILFDAENPTLIKNGNGYEQKYVGLYSLTDEDREGIVKGISCTPTSLFELLNPNFHDVGEKRIYGNRKLTKFL